MSRDVVEQAGTIGQILATRAAQRPDHEVVRTSEQAITYAALDDAATRFANVLAGLGLVPGDAVAVLLPNGRAFLDTWFGISRGGFVEVPLNVALKGDLLADQIHRSGAQVLVIGAEHLDRVAAIDERLPHLRHVLCVGVPSASVDGAEVLALEQVLAEAATGPPDVTVDPTSPSGILFTSGTTGPSKGVVRSHVADFTLARTTIEIMGYEPGERLFTVFPLFHLNAKFNSVLPAMLLDGTLILHDRFSASTFWDVARDEGVTAFNFMGALLTMLLKQPERENDRDHEVRCAYGAPAPATIFGPFEERFGVRLVEVYGSTELGITTMNTVEQVKVGSCGTAAPYYEVLIHDEHDRPCPPGTPGEIVVRPSQPSVMFSHYHGMPEETLESFRNLWFHTGDRARMDEDGYVYFIDRMKDAIRRRGENISSFEVERTLATLEEVAEVAVIGVPSELTEEEVLAVIVFKEGHQLSYEAILDHCQDRLPHFAVPRYLRIIDELPKTPSQRVKKHRLREEGLTDGTWDREGHGYRVQR